MTVRFRLIISICATVQSQVSYILIAQLLYKNSERREQQQDGKTTFYRDSSSKTGKQRFTGIDVAEPHPILYKYSERREQQQNGKTTFYRD